MNEPTAEASIDVDAPADRLWRIVADITRTPEWSPVCHRCEWVDTGEGGPSSVGARFRGHNRLNGARWSRECVVTESEPGRVFSFSTIFKGDESTRWRYTVEPRGDGSRLTEAYEVVMMPPWVRLLRRIPGVAAKSDRDTASNLATSVARLKALAEQR